MAVVGADLDRSAAWDEYLARLAESVNRVYRDRQAALPAPQTAGPSSPADRKRVDGQPDMFPACSARPPEADREVERRAPVRPTLPARVAVVR